MSRRIEGLDLLRGLAVALVMLRHALPVPFAGAGVVGVVMFFALSGYLITGLLLERPPLREFYRRRAVRLVPALLVLVLGVVLVTLVWDPLGDRAELPRTVATALTWTGDLPFGHGSDATFHLWTLALEEQFYLLWPWVILAGLARRLGPALAAAAIVCVLATLATVWWCRAAPDLAYSLPTSWAGCFVLGGVTRVYADRLPDPTRLVPVVLAALGVLSVVPLRGHATTYLLVGPGVAVLTALLVLAWRERVVVTAPIPSLLVRLGTVSYAAYLWNYPLTLWLQPSTAYAGPIAAVLTVLVAVLSHRSVEQPALARWGRRRVEVHP